MRFRPFRCLRHPRLASVRDACCLLTGGALEVERVVGREHEAARGLVDGVVPVLYVRCMHAP